MWEKYIDHSIACILNTKASVEPYWHLHVKNFYHEELFEQILDNTNWDTTNTLVTRRGNTRIVVNPLDQTEKWDFFREYSLKFHSKLIETVQSLPGANKEHHNIETELLYDCTGGRQVLHVDRPYINVSLMIFICSGGDTTCGTTLHRNENDPGKLIEFVPNTGWLIVNGPHALHSAPEIKCSNRYSIMHKFNCGPKRVRSLILQKENVKN